MRFWVGDRWVVTQGDEDPSLGVRGKPTSLCAQRPVLNYILLKSASGWMLQYEDPWLELRCDRPMKTHVIRELSNPVTLEKGGTG